MFLSNGKSGFTLIELLVVIAIIGVLSTLAIVALGGARTKARDSKRVADMKQISTALELYFSDNSSYPTIITPGQAIISPDGLTTYMANIPSNPTPRNDNSCGNNDYTYSSTSDNTNYSLNFCLGNTVASTPAGINSVSSSGIGTAPGLVGWWKLDETSGTTAYDSSGNNNNGTISGAVTQNQAGKLGAAFSWNGSNGGVSIPGANFALSAYTITLWLKPANNTTCGLVGRSSTGATATNINLWWGWSPGVIDNLFGNGSTYQNGLSSNGFPLSTWSFLAFTFNGSQYQWYINNLTDLTGTITNSSPPSSALLYIGSLGSYLNPFNGLIDDVRIYNRALSTAEVLALYNATK